MQELVFNTTLKTVELKESRLTTPYYKFTNISTVKSIEGYYEVIQESDEVDENSGKNKKYPIFRAPISNTNMIIER